MNATSTHRATSALARSSRAQFSPISPRLSARVRDADARRIVSSAAFDFAERSFLNRWAQPTLLDRLQPALTRYRE